ncbi:NAD(+) diphosphatase [Saccharomycopsis crataegensis]|uniref:NAD(+) diphosphatase n=1 Tax=Saccharomycopsis crataegensis TaxID=43959 RepID=A0AAV5QVF2_9ASCO|nr:NAD(+) diphosphatase [Saccharomycopsis crataegensis]
MSDDIFFAHETINRVSFLREDAEFIIQAINFENTNILFLKDNYPLVEPLEEKAPSPVPQLLKFKAGADKTIHEYLIKWSLLNKDQSYDLRFFPNIVFLGLMEPENDSDKAMEYKDGKYSGIPCFMIDVSESTTKFAPTFVEKNGDDYKLDLFKVLQQTSYKFDILNNRSQILQMKNHESSLLAYGKMFLDWLGKQNFCPQCASPIIKIQAGTKLKCTSKLISSTTDEKTGKVKNIYECGSKNLSVSNIQFPRTDPVCIIAVVNLQHNKILLGNGLRFPNPKFYTCIAGFMEPGESIETCCSREIWEETGVHCSKVMVLHSQPWPFPANLMIGCIGVVEFNGKNELVDLGNDPELRDAKWFDFEEVKEALAKQESGGVDNNYPLVLPPKNAISHVLIDTVVNKRFTKL